MADYNLNFTRTCIYISVMYNILHCMTQLMLMHMYNSRDKIVQRSITCTSRYIHVYMTLYMYRNGCYGVTPLPHRYGCHKVTPHPCHCY